MENTTDNVVLCASSKYEQKFYMNEDFEVLPSEIKKELKIMCVLFTEDVGGIISLEFDEAGKLHIITTADEGDLLYDDIGCGLKVKQLKRDYAKTLKSMELYYRVFFLNESPEDIMMEVEEEE